MTCYKFSIRPIIPESENVKVSMKKFDEDENEDFCEEEKKSISTLRTLFSAKKTYFGKIFAQDGLFLAEQKIDFRKIFVKASSSQNLENSGF